VEKKERYFTGNIRKYLSAKKFLPRHKKGGRFHLTSILDKRENKTASGFVLQNILLKIFRFRRLLRLLFYTAENFLCTDPMENTISIIKGAYLLIRCQAIIVLFLRALASAGIYLQSRCLPTGVHVTL
jgi:hypothetical protein